MKTKFMILVLKCLVELLVREPAGGSRLAIRLRSECYDLQEELEDEGKPEPRKVFISYPDGLPFLERISDNGTLTVKEESELNKLYLEGPGAGIE